MREEVSFVLSDTLRSSGIKIHAIESRVKDYYSWNNKLREKILNDNHEIEDMVGARVVCLFKSDINRLENILSDKFEVINKDDKINESTDSFGYMSVHYICVMKSSYRGPRYNKIKNTKFEIQLRTICMHAWAAISHYLDYKSEWDIPEHLRKGLNALSGLFYVADDQYETLYNARQASRDDADDNANSAHVSDVSVNLDTMAAYLSTKYPDRRISSNSEISGLVSELFEANYNTISKIDEAVNFVSKQFKEDEINNIKSMNEKCPYYTQVGAVRVSLGIFDSKYKQISTIRNINIPTSSHVQDIS